MQPELKVRKILGRTYLNENRLEEALDIFIKILMDYPDDLETLLILGGFYLASGDGKTAKSLYQRAQQLEPGNKTIQRQIHMADEVEDDEIDESIPTDMDAVTRLLQRLTGREDAVQDEDVLRAASLLDQIINSTSPADLVSDHLDEIDGLLQALIEVNIRQARADGRADVADALHNLQLNIDCQLVAKETPKRSAESLEDLTATPYPVSILLLLPDLEKKSSRVTLLKSMLESCGYCVTEKREYIPERDAKPDLVITSNPHIHPALVESLSVLSTEGVPVVLDLDTDFKNQPVSNHEYSDRGLNTQARSDAYAAAISLADLITVSSQELALILREVSERVLVIPDGWSQQNKLWEKPSSAHSMINIGWVSSSGELADLILIRRFLIRIIHEFPNTRIVMIGNPQAYRLFDGLPENRRLYLPLVAHDEFPYLLSQLDILLAPLRNLPYNLSLPDTILMQAGARGVPWIASSIPSFRAWNCGGILTESIEEWHLNLRHLVMDHELRTRLGRAGRDAARIREMEYVRRTWLEVVVQLTGVNTLPLQNVEKVKYFV